MNCSNIIEYKNKKYSIALEKLLEHFSVSCRKSRLTIKVCILESSRITMMYSDESETSGWIATLRNRELMADTDKADVELRIISSVRPSVITA